MAVGGDAENDAHAGCRLDNENTLKKTTKHDEAEFEIKERGPGHFRSTCPEFDPEKDFILITAGVLDKRLLSAVWVENNSHLSCLAQGCQGNNLASKAIRTQ